MFSITCSELLVQNYLFRILKMAINNDITKTNAIIGLVMTVKIAVTGAAGRMGKTLIEAVAMLKSAAKVWLSMTTAEMNTALRAGEIKEVKQDE